MVVLNVLNVGTGRPSVVVPITMLSPTFESASLIRDLNQSSQMCIVYTVVYASASKSPS
jgi:hypothetical protein